jgi:hypothetical protein
MAKYDFGPEKWHEIVTKVAAAFQLPKEKAAKLEANKTAQLIAAIPFLAACDHPERTAIAHLGTFILASSESCKKVFDHDPSDDKNPTARLAPIADFVGGDKAIIAEGMTRLVMVMANGYRKDVEKDKKSGEYNPVGAAAWKTEDMHAKYLAAAKSAASTALDPVMTAELAVRYFWDQ